MIRPGEMAVIDERFNKGTIIHEGVKRVRVKGIQSRVAFIRESGGVEVPTNNPGTI